VLIVVALSLLAAAMFAGGAVLQQRAVHRDARVADAGLVGGRLLDRAVIGRLPHDPEWRLGWVIQSLGYLVQAVALHFGSTAVVQPLMVTQLLFALLLSTVGTRRRLTAREWFGATAVCGGLVVLLAVQGAVPTTGTPDRPRLLLCTIVVSAAAAVLVAASGASWVRRSPVRRAVLLAIAAGLFTGLGAAAIKVTTFELINNGVLATARDWPGYLVAASAATALLLSQSSFARGPLAASLTALTITSPIAGYLLGVFAFHATPPTSPGSLAGVAAAGLLIVVGVVLLAHSPTVASSFRPGATEADDRRASLAPSPTRPAKWAGTNRSANGDGRRWVGSDQPGGPGGWQRDPTGVGDGEQPTAG